MSAAACARSEASSSASGRLRAGDSRAAFATPAIARKARSNSLIRRSIAASLTKKRAPEGARFMTLLLCLEPVRDAHEERAWIRPGERRVAGAVLHRWRARPGELGRCVVIDLRPANAHVGALREPVLVADVVLLRARARAANVRLKLLRLRVRRA